MIRFERYDVHGRTDGRTDGQTDGHDDLYISIFFKNDRDNPKPVIDGSIGYDCQVYESYYSDHKPIILTIKNL